MKLNHSNGWLEREYFQNKLFPNDTLQDLILRKKLFETSRSAFSSIKFFSDEGLHLENRFLTVKVNNCF